MERVGGRLDRQGTGRVLLVWLGSKSHLNRVPNLDIPRLRQEGRSRSRIQAECPGSLLSVLLR